MGLKLSDLNVFNDTHEAISLLLEDNEYIGWIVQFFSSIDTSIVEH